MSAPTASQGAGGTFSVCSFRYVHAFTRTRRQDEADPAFEKMLTRVGHLCPYTEETSRTAEQLGLFPRLSRV
ncbi:hypothetical protein ACFC0C_27255 [Streptomyces sp. NPDC056178]|uniref:hypothetical protein n=1 Tax=unclassified Streptomyces TaxID=2593676 RepID=UPI0035DD8D95